MSDLKTQLNDQNVENFLDEIEDEQKRADYFELLDLMTETKAKIPKCGEKVWWDLAATTTNTKVGERGTGS